MSSLRRCCAPRFFFLLLVACLSALLAAPAARAQSRVECATVRSTILSRAVRFCALLPPSYDRDKTRRFAVLYHLHGLGDNEQSLVNWGGWDLVERLREQGRIGEFLIITPDGARSFYVNSRDGRTRYEDFFIQEFLPAIEQRYRARPGRRWRGITGISMGGFGAIRFAFKYPYLFGSVSAHSAALVEKPARSLANDPAMGLFGSVFGRPLDPVFWERNSPFTLARQGSVLAGLKIYFDCGQEDDYGFEAGAQALHELLRARRIPHEFHLYPGRHDWIYFAEHLPASLEFHGQSFPDAPKK